MSFLGALFKPLKKIVKKIGKKVKKVFKKIGRAVGKLGIVGQIGMMFLMPYAAGALGSFFGSAGTLSKWGATLLGKPGIASKALGHTLNAINTVGTTIGKVYTGVTDTISNAFDIVMNKGREILGIPKAPVSPGDIPVTSETGATSIDHAGKNYSDEIPGKEAGSANSHDGVRWAKKHVKQFPGPPSEGPPAGKKHDFFGRWLSKFSLIHQCCGLQENAVTG